MRSSDLPLRNSSVATGPGATAFPMPDDNPEQRPRPRKTPQQARSHETVRIIVETAARILERDGRDGFSTNAVAERAGVSIGSLYQYFPRKEALLGALIMRETSLLIDDAERAAAEPPRQADGDAAARDVMAITKGMVDAAGVRGETDRHDLSIRVRRAVFGYLDASV